MKKIVLSLTLLFSVFTCFAQSNLYGFTVQDAEGASIKLSDYKGKVLLIVNTASHCGFTPQYTELEEMYSQLRGQGFEILDFPCNQFGEQAPESDAEYVAFCKANYETEFKQFHKIDVNGKEEAPLFGWLKKKLPFKGLDKGHKLTPVLEGMFDKNNPGWRESSDIKWNFTKFLVDRKGKTVARFEPTATAADMLPAIQALLK